MSVVGTLSDDDKEFLKAIINGCWRDDTYYDTHYANRDDSYLISFGWTKILPHKEEIIKGTIEEYAVIVKNLWTWERHTKEVEDTWKGLVENYISKRATVESNGKRYKLKASGREFIIGKSSIDTVEIFLKGEKDAILIKTSDFNQVSVEIK